MTNHLLIQMTRPEPKLIRLLIAKRYIMKVADRSWSDEEMELIREAFRAKVIRLGKLLHDGENTNDKHSQRIRYECNKYKEFYKAFGGEDPIE